MTFINIIDIHALSLVMLILILYNAGKRAEHGNPQFRLFAAMSVILCFILVMDAAAWMADGKPGELARALNWIFVIGQYLPVPFMPALYALYTDYQVFHDKLRLRRLWRFLAVYVALDQVFMLSSIWTGWSFAIDQANRYSHGPFIAVHTFSGYAVLLYTCAFTVKHRKRIDPRHFVTLMTFGLPPVAAAAIQGNSTGFGLMWSGMALSMLLLYMNIQDGRLDTDYLTGTYNRRLLDSLVESRIKTSARGKSFSAILIDLDNFKQINDTYGHDIGDDALLEAAGLLKSCLRSGDFITRYGGDEFLIILDISSMKALEEAVARIRECFEQFNRGNSKSYELRFSMGYDTYGMASGMDPDDFIKHIDTLMYEDKKLRNTGSAGRELTV